MADLKFSGFDPEAVAATTEIVGYKTGTTSNTRYSITQLADGLKVHGGLLECFMMACSDETTDITATADKIRIQMPYAFTLTEIKASLTTAPTGSGATTVNVYNVTDSDTVINTAALSFAAAAISANSTSFTAGQDTIAEDDVIAVDVAAIAGTTGGAGLKVTLIGYQTP